MTYGAVDARGSVGVIDKDERHRSTCLPRVGWAGVWAVGTGVHITLPIGCRARTRSTHRTGMRKARAVQAYRVDHPERLAAARAYAVERAAVLGPLMADVPALRPKEP